jgi:hypothetical protein
MQMVTGPTSHGEKSLERADAAAVERLDAAGESGWESAGMLMG